MITMKQARRMAPHTPAVHEEKPLEGKRWYRYKPRKYRFSRARGDQYEMAGMPPKVVSYPVYPVRTPKTLKVPFRAWAREHFRGTTEKLSPKLHRIVFGGKR